MAAPTRPPFATFADLAALGDDVEAELVHGAIVERASPTARHGRAQARVAGQLGRRFDRRPGGRWPGGWWFGTEIDVAYAPDEVFRHDVVGWRRDRVPEVPAERPVRARPDWVCEIVSPSNRRRDQVDKLQVLHGAGVPHYWLVDPEEQVLVVHRHTPQGYLVVLTASAGAVVRAEPFDAVELRVAVLFGDEDDDD